MRSLLLLALAAVPVLAAANIPSKFSSDSEAPTSEDLICHPGVACYPRHFQPTSEFQIVHDDQDIPPGLHIRMNFETGVKEAKILAPEEDAAEETNDIVIVEDGGENMHTEYIPPAYSPPALHSDDAPVRPPKDAAAGDGVLFQDSLATLVSSDDSVALDFALSNLEELAHELYWGAELASPAPLKSLLSLISSAPSPKTRSSAALVLGSALSNNPKALSKALDNGASSLVDPLLKALEEETDSAARKRVLFAIAQAMKQELCADAFVRAGGIQVLQTAIPRVHEIEFSSKIAVLIEDTFLNEDMGADTGDVGRPQLSKAFCIPLQYALLAAPKGHRGAQEKVFNALVALGTECEAGVGLLEWMRSLESEAQGRSVQELMDNGETLVAAVVEKGDVLRKTSGRGEL